MHAGKNGETFCAVVNPAKDLAWRLNFNIKQLPYFTQWKCIRSGDYVMGMELSMCPLDMDPNNVFYLSSFNKFQIKIIVEIIDDQEEIVKMIREAELLKKEI